jgi:hypothetical protein
MDQTRTFLVIVDEDAQNANAYAWDGEQAQPIAKQLSQDQGKVLAETLRSTRPTEIQAPQDVQSLLSRFLPEAERTARTHGL